MTQVEDGMDDEIDKVLKTCNLRGHYDTPHLNDNLYLHNASLKSLDMCSFHLYYNLRSLHVSGNNITKICGLEYLSLLRCLYLQNNDIQQIEGLEANLELRILDLSSNRISRIENLSHLKQLTHLNLENNAITSLSQTSQLSSLPSLTQLNLSRNQISFDPSPAAFFRAATPSLKCLYLQGNASLRPLTDLRPSLIACLPQLTYLDTRPVSAQERGLSLSQPPLSPGRGAFLTARREAALARIRGGGRLEEEETTTQEDTASDRSLAEMD